MRSIKELLEVMLINQQHFRTGLCYWVTRLHEENIISSAEFCNLYVYIQQHRPNKFLSITAWKQRNSAWFWSSYTIEPRIHWINQQILKEEKILSKLRN